MRAGELRDRIDIERATAALNSLGEPEPTWAAIISNVPANVRPLEGDERFIADQVLAKEQFEFRVRWSITLADVSPTDRVIYPSGDGQAFDVVAVSEIGRREGVSIRAKRNIGVPIA